MTNKDVATMPGTAKWVKRRINGTIKNPPPTPSKPVIRPVNMPMAANTNAATGVHMNLPVSLLINAKRNASSSELLLACFDCL